ncbi:RNA polymerase sigma factor [Arthrobacter sp. zg-Y20]|uniref:RNA polymerase sigma factor n=1 Tax=unclassified Arthrobacter TaxID=235627 RepID=UPI001D158460|nr:MULTISPECIES: RNA polymerase sigma factor [unclassified Arthrobacter]MCC3275920.1 RNA polymerase sigma factor [Arthrobacter sp. zg-Y20]MDK1316077.1 RNA polymerase sigma factor [Arthrobacter sp. zg.Y20]WIB05633.1 RNA polymerase sigma factor [Arthrobacter sp. zg-Y20]
MSVQSFRKEQRDVDREKCFLAAHAAGHDRIYRYFRRRTENAATAEDLCAEVFRIAWEKTGQEESLSVMVLFGIAKNVLRNHDRSASRSASLLGALQLERDHERNDDDSRIHEALARLGPDEREVLLLTYWDGFSSSEVSDLLNTSATAVRMRLHRARKALGRLLDTESLSEGAK